MLKILVVWGWKQQWKRTNRGKILLKKKASRVPPNQWKRLSCKQRLSNLIGCWKSWWFGVENNNEKGQAGGKFTWKLMCPEFHQINRKGHKSPTKIIKINLDVENADGLGVKTRMKRDKEGAKFTWKWMCPEFHQINRKGQVTNKDYQNYLGCWKSWSFGVETTMKKDKQGENLHEN